MGKLKYILSGLFIWALSWAGGIVTLNFCFKILGNLSPLKTLCCLIMIFFLIIIFFIGGTYLGWMQMQAPADPKRIKVKNSDRYLEMQYKTIVMIIQSGCENVNGFRRQYLNENFAYPKGATHCALLYKYTDKGVKEMGRFEGSGCTHFLHLEDKFLIPTNYKIIKKAKNVNAKFWVGFCDSQSQRYDVRNFTLLEEPGNKDRIFYSDFIDDISEIDSIFDNIPSDIKETIKVLSLEEGIKVLSDYLKH